MESREQQQRSKRATGFHHLALFPEARIRTGYKRQ